MISVLLVIIASIVYGFLPIFTKNIIKENYSSVAIVFYRYAFTAIFLFFIILIRRKSFKINKRQFLELLLFSVVGLGLTFFFLSLSLSYISAGLTNMIHFGYPVVVIILMAIVYKEKINILKILSVISAAIGIVLLTRVVEVESFKGVIYALITTVTYGVYIISNKNASFAKLDTMVSLFYMSLFVSIVFFVWGISTNSIKMIDSIYVFNNFLVVSLLCTIFSLTLLLYGVKQLGSSLASILNMFEPTTTVIASIFIYNETLTINILFGSILVVMSTIFMIMSSKLKT